LGGALERLNEIVISLFQPAEPNGGSEEVSGPNGPNSPKFADRLSLLSRSKRARSRRSRTERAQERQRERNLMTQQTSSPRGR